MVPHGLAHVCPVAALRAGHLSCVRAALMNAQLDRSFSPVDESLSPAAEDDADDFVSSLLPYMGVTALVAIVVVSTLIAAAEYVLHR
jgi:hypothetical protein